MPYSELERVASDRICTRCYFRRKYTTPEEDFCPRCQNPEFVVPGESAFLDSLSQAQMQRYGSSISFTVFGKPLTQGSKTVVPTKGGYRAVERNHHQLRAWRAAVSEAAARAMGDNGLLDSPVEMLVVFRFPRPLSHFGTGRNAGKLRASAPRFCCVRKDLSKLVRAVEDALNGVVFRDDSQIVHLRAIKEYGKRYETHIQVWKLETGS